MRLLLSLPRTALPLALALVAGCAEPVPEGPAVMRLTPEGGDQWEGVRSPDGRQMAWLNRGAEQVELWVSDSAGQARKLADLGGNVDVAPRWSPDGRLLSYASRHNTDNFDLWVADLRAGTTRSIVATAGIEIPVGWHPSAPKLIYSSSRGARWGCHVHDLTTGENRALVPDLPGACGIWSPDGSRLAYQDIEGASARGARILVADADGRNGRPVTTEGMEFISLDGGHGPWSPDGRQLLYESRRTGRPDLWVVNAEGGAPVQLTRDIRSDRHGVWSPDGQRVAFVSDRGGQTDLWVMPASGGTPTRLTNTPEEEDALPQWAPDGSRVLFTATRPVSQLWRMQLASGEATPFSPDDQIASAPELSPDGTQVAYEAERSGGTTDIFLLPTAGGKPRPLAARSGINGFIRFAPDGDRITFHSNRTGLINIWTVDTAGTTATPITSDSAGESRAQWSADGRTIYFWRGGTGLGDVWGVPALGGPSRQVSRLGTVFAFWVNPVRDEVYVGAVNDAGRSTLMAVNPTTGDSRMLFDAAPLADMPRYAFSDDGRYASIGVVDSAGGIATLILDVETGATKRVGSGRSIPDGLSPDGRYMMLRAWRPGQFNPDLQLMDVEAGTSRWLTETPEWEGSTRWLPGGEDIVFVRRDYREHLAEVAVPAARPGP